LELANLYRVINPPVGFLEWAVDRGAVEIESDEEWHSKKKAHRD
jgi:hypothetical protein